MPARITTSRPAARLRSALFISNHRRFGACGRAGAWSLTVSGISMRSTFPRANCSTMSSLARFPGDACPRSE